MKRLQLKGGLLIGLEPLKIEQGDLLVEDGRIIASGERVPSDSDTFVLDCRGKYILPGLANSRLRLPGESARLLPDAHADQGCDRLEQSLTPETAVALAFNTAMDAIRQGTTSANVCLAVNNDAAEMLRLVRDTFLTIGLRGVLHGEITAGLEREQLVQVLDEIVRESDQGHTSTMKLGIALRDLESFSDEELNLVSERLQGHSLPLQFDVTADEENIAASIERLSARDLLGTLSTINPACRLPDDLSADLAARGIWVTYCPTSAARGGHQLGVPSEFGDNVMLGTNDGGCNVLEEARFGQLLARATGADTSCEDLIRIMVGSHAHASTALGYELGGIHQDATADLIILNYPSNQPIDSSNLAAHLVAGMAPRHIETVIIGGDPILRGRRFPDIDMRRLRPLLRLGANELYASVNGMEED